MNLRKSVILFTYTFTERLVYFTVLFISAECFSIPLAPTTRLCALVLILCIPLTQIRRYYLVIDVPFSCKCNFAPCHTFLFLSLFCWSLTSNSIQIRALQDFTNCRQLRYHQAIKNCLYSGCNSLLIENNSLPYLYKRLRTPLGYIVAVLVQ